MYYRDTHTYKHTPPPHTHTHTHTPHTHPHKHPTQKDTQYRNENKMLRNYGDIRHEKKGCEHRNENLKIEGE